VAQASCLSHLYKLNAQQLIVLNDVYRVQSIDVPTSEAIANLKEKLLVCGYEQWLEEE
jgi:hypothetical protein